MRPSAPQKAYSSSLLEEQCPIDLAFREALRSLSEPNYNASALGTLSRIPRIDEDHRRDATTIAHSGVESSVEHPTATAHTLPQTSAGSEEVEMSVKQENDVMSLTLYTEQGNIDLGPRVPRDTLMVDVDQNGPASDTSSTDSFHTQSTPSGCSTPSNESASYAPSRSSYTTARSDFSSLSYADLERMPSQSQPSLQLPNEQIEVNETPPAISSGPTNLYGGDTHEFGPVAESTSKVGIKRAKTWLGLPVPDWTRTLWKSGRGRNERTKLSSRSHPAMRNENDTGDGSNTRDGISVYAGLLSDVNENPNAVNDRFDEEKDMAVQSKPSASSEPAILLERTFTGAEWRKTHDEAGYDASVKFAPFSTAISHREAERRPRRRTVNDLDVSHIDRRVSTFLESTYKSEDVSILSRSSTADEDLLSDFASNKIFECQ